MAAESHIDSIESKLSTAGRELNPVDFIEGLYYGTLGQAVDSLKQLSGRAVAAADPEANTSARKAGELIGALADVVVVSQVTHGLFNNELDVFAKKALLKDTARASGQLALTGALYGAVLTPSHDNAAIIQGRLTNLITDASSFAVMGGVGKALEFTAQLSGETLLAASGRNAIAGGISGIPAAFTSEYFNNNRIAGTDELATAVEHGAAFGFGFGALSHGFELATHSDLYYRSRWAIEHKAREVKYASYSTLDNIGMRHPFRNLGDWLSSTNDAPVQRPAITEQNNPVFALKPAVQNYVKALNDNAEMFHSDKGDRWAMFQQREAIQADFAFELLKTWHGSGEAPGIKNYSDAELASDKMPIDRVASIREALSSTGKGRITNRESPFDEKMYKLFPELQDLPAGDNSLLAGISKARERFFSYDSDALFKKMSMPRFHAYIDHEHNTPASWSPLAEDDPAPRFFHGTMSRALNTVATERTIFPARELRERALLQSTGESALEEFGRRDVSLTRDFNEAFAYHQHSPTYLADFPIVFGIAKNVAAHARSAGSQEAGELLVKKLRFGDSMLASFGLGKSEVKEIYVPSSQVRAVNELLAARRISGINVTDFANISEPNWLPEPTLEEMQARYR